MNIYENIKNIINSKFNNHPYNHGITHDNIERLLSNYLAMSQAFPYIQSGSQANLILNTIENNQGITPEMEITTVVGNFLCWDETGGLACLMKNGMEGLPDILNTGNNFHSNMLKNDINYLLNKNISPDYSEATQDYLLSLMKSLSDLNNLRRLAYMVAFEHHAGEMISALWLSLGKLFNVDRDKLLYFKVHVGGEDPAEPYHIEMTNRMIDRFVYSEDDLAIFLDYFTQASDENFSWCERTKHLN